MKEQLSERDPEPRETDLGTVISTKKMAMTNLANLFFRLDLSLDLAVLVHVTAIVVVLEILIKKIWK